MYIVFNGAQEINLEDKLFLRGFLLAARALLVCFFMVFWW